MDEMNTTVETTETTAEDYAAFDEAWGDAPAADDDFDLGPDEDEGEADGGNEAENETDAGGIDAGDESAEADAESAPAGSGGAETAENAENTAETADPKAEEGHQLYTLKSPKGERQCGIDEVLTLANKGMDYDGVRDDRDNLREFLTELAQSGGMSIDELIDSTRARMLVQKRQAEGNPISETDALFTVQRERAEKKAARAAETAKAEEQTRNRMISDFIAEFPDVQATDIPNSVWAESRETGNLAAAYRKYANNQKDAELQRLKKEIETLKQNKKNKERSTGSMRSSGVSSSADPFEEGWNSL